MLMKFNKGQDGFKCETLKMGVDFEFDTSKMNKLLGYESKYYGRIKGE